MKAFLHELRQAVLGLANRPGFSMLVVGVLAAGLACVIYMLIAVDSLVLRPLPFPGAQQLQAVGLDDSRDRGGQLEPVRSIDLLHLRDYLVGKAEVSGYQQATVNLSDLDRPERFSGAFVTGNLFHVLGVAPALGRDFSLADERAGAPPVVMLSHDLWTSRYGADPGVVGRHIRVNAQAATVVGVMPEDFSWPSSENVWMAKPVVEDADADLAFRLVLRRRAEVDDGAVEAAIGTWFGDAARAEPEHFRGLRATVEPLALVAVSATTREVLNVMLVAALLVLLIACANAANLLLARTLNRRQELAVRVALGASRGRLILHLIAQSLLLSFIAAAIALPAARLAAAWTEASFRTAEDGPPHWIHFTLDINIVWMTLGVVVVTALLAGALPALRAGGSAMASDLRDGVRSVGGGFARISRVLMVGEVALSLTLLMTVGALTAVVAALDDPDAGIEPGGILTARVGLFESAYPTGADQLRLFDQITERLRADPAVIDATAATGLPGLNGDNRAILAEGEVAGDAALPRIDFAAVDDHFLAAYGLHLQRGRFFDRHDDADTTPVAVVDRRFVDRYSDKGEVIGRRFLLDPGDEDAPLVTVVGVLPALWMGGPGAAVRPSMLVPLRQQPDRFVSLAVHVRGDPAAFAPNLVDAIRAVAPDTPAYWVRTYAESIRQATFSTRMLAKMFTGFGLLALVLAGAGLYGVIAFNVAQRTREIGVRRALGAQPSSVLRDVLARAGWQVALGLAVGLGLGLGLTRLLTSVLNSNAGTSAMSVLGALAVLLIAAFIAVVVPARRALRIDPMVALRHE